MPYAEYSLIMPVCRKFAGDRSDDVQGAKRKIRPISYAAAIASGCIVKPRYALMSHVIATDTSPIFCDSEQHSGARTQRKRKHDELLPDQTAVEYRRYRRARIERLARELDQAVRAYSEADSESVLKEDLASEEDEKPSRRCKFIDDEAEEDLEIYEEKDEFIVLDDDGDIAE